MGLRTIIYLNNKHISYMESNELLASLAKMEASLNEVESARKQVESTVNASSELQKEVREYVSAVKALCVSLQSWASDLRVREGELSHEYESAIARVNDTCAQIIQTFGTNVEQTTADFKSKTENAIEKFTEQNMILTERVQDLNALKEDIKKATSEIQAIKESLVQLSKNLKESQDQQDVELGKIKELIEKLPQSIEGCANTVKQAISQSEEFIIASLNEAKGKIDEVKSKANDILSGVGDLKSQCQDINSTLSTKTEELTNSIQKSQIELAKVNKFNRNILVVGFVITCLLQFFIIVVLLYKLF